MHRGVRFEISQIKYDVLNDILSSIDIKKYNWYNIDEQNETWLYPEGTLLFEKDFYTGGEFEKVIRKKHKIIFLKLQAYTGDHFFENICSYNQFINSDCQIVVLIYDCEFADIYAKDRDIIKYLYSDLIMKGFHNVQYITDDDTRTCMNIM